MGVEEDLLEEDTEIFYFILFSEGNKEISGESLYFKLALRAVKDIT